MITTLYHGSSNFNPTGGYKGGKIHNFQYGVGLYTTNSYLWAEHYGRSVYALTVELKEEQHANSVEITIANLQYWCNVYCTKKLAKLFKKEFSERETMTAHRFELWLYWNVRGLHKIAKELAAFFTAQGVTHNSDAGNYGGKLIRIYDFDIISNSTKDKQVLKELDYQNTDLPDYLKDRA